MHNKAKILLVEDDPSLGLVVKDYLLLSGYECSLVADGLQAVKTYQREHFDLCVLDIMLPSLDGISIAQKIRENDKNIPILFLSSKQSKEDKVIGFKTGADDYITKPFNIEELVLRIEVFLKRSKNQTPEKDIYSIGSYLFNYGNLMLQKENITITLSRKEAEILKLFCMNPEGVVKREDILNTIWGTDDYFKGRSLDVFISRLRKILSDDKNIEIENLYSIGYCLKIKT